MLDWSLSKESPVLFGRRHLVMGTGLLQILGALQPISFVFEQRSSTLEVDGEKLKGSS
jgi:hypothetical protein